MCRCSGEMVDHLLLHCSVAFELWSFVQARLLSYYVSGGFGEGKKSRILFLYVCCGLYGGKEIDELLKMWKPRGVNCYQPSLAPYILCIGFYR